MKPLPHGHGAHPSSPRPSKELIKSMSGQSPLTDQQKAELATTEWTEKHDLFQNGQFKSHSGLKLDFKIECDALSDGSLHTLAMRIQRKLIYGEVVGVPRGGLRFARQLQRYATPSVQRLLIVDDVLTTGSSMEKCKRLYRDKYAEPNIVGIVIFSRGLLPYWIKAIFSLSPEL